MAEKNKKTLKKKMVSKNQNQISKTKGSIKKKEKILILTKEAFAFVV